MFATEEQALEMVCWKSIGSTKEHNCYCTRCHAWGWVMDIYYITECPHCKRVITGVDVKGMVGDQPLGTCKATKR